jgi:hypothetical protein
VTCHQIGRAPAHTESRIGGLGIRRRFHKLSRRSWQHADLICALCLSLAAFALYAVTAVPGPSNGDRGEWQYMPRILGLPHPTGFPLYLLLGWVWSWLPLGSLAFRSNLFSTFWAAVTVGLVYGVARHQGLRRVAAFAGALFLALVPAFWRYAGMAEVYALHSSLLTAALAGWLCWERASQHSAARWLWTAALLTGLALTNHPTAAFLVPVAALFLLMRWFRWPGKGGGISLPQRPGGAGARPDWRSLGIGAISFALPGLLYLYVPLRLWMIGPGVQQFGLSESIAKGRVAPFLDWTWQGVLRYITGGDFMGGYNLDPSLLVTSLPGLLAEQFGLPLLALGAVGGILWLVSRPRSGVGLLTLFLLATINAVSYAAGFAEHGEVVDLDAHLVSVYLVFALWVAQGLSSGINIGIRVLRNQRLSNGLVALAVVVGFAVRCWGMDLPTSRDRVESRAVEDYWTEVLSYPLEEGSALTGHWGDLTPLWYYQHGEGVRRDLWTISPPDRQQIEVWLRESRRPVYLVGPLLDWGSDLSDEYTLTPWGVLVRIDPRESTPSLPLLEGRSELFGDRLQLEGYAVHSPSAGRWQLWLGWYTTAPISRDLSVSVRLHAADGTLLSQKDGRLASSWYPEAVLPSQRPLLSVFDLELDGPLPHADVRIVVYDPSTMVPLLTPEGQDVFDLGPIKNDL